jgi:hypothetical protein
VLNWSTIPEVKNPLHFTLLKSLLTPQIPSFAKITHADPNLQNSPVNQKCQISHDFSTTKIPQSFVTSHFK